MTTLLEIHLFTVQDYHRMIESGILDEDDRVELLEGQIVKKAAKGTSHCAAVKRTEKLLENRLGNKVLLQLHGSVELYNYSEPEPDISVVIPDPFYYEDHHPNPQKFT